MIRSFFALLALSTLCIPQVDASKASDPIQFFTGSELVRAGADPELVATVAAANVPVIKGDETFAFCNRDGFITRAGYNTAINAIIICLNHSTQATIAESFTHEALHLAQDCQAGLHNEQLMAGTPLQVRNIWDHGLTEAQRENIKRSYLPDDWDLETEAFFFQTRPDVVQSAVASFCF